jgi:Sulfotransferase domain.
MGLINICFPKAKIILTHRNPRDVCFSILRNNFTSSNMNWTFSESDIIKYYGLYKQITEFWKEKIKENIYEINYEKLIFDNENEVKKLLEFCELNFEKECLDHSKNSKSKIASASVLQARQPIYKTSINNSKKYEKYLGKLFLNIE